MTLDTAPEQQLPRQQRRADDGDRDRERTEIPAHPDHRAFEVDAGRVDRNVLERLEPADEPDEPAVHVLHPRAHQPREETREADERGAHVAIVGQENRRRTARRPRATAPRRRGTRPPTRSRRATSCRRLCERSWKYSPLWRVRSTSPSAMPGTRPANERARRERRGALRRPRRSPPTTGAEPRDREQHRAHRSGTRSRRSGSPRACRGTGPTSPRGATSATRSASRATTSAVNNRICDGISEYESRENETCGMMNASASIAASAKNGRRKSRHAST